MRNYVALGDLVMDVYYDNAKNLLGYYVGGSPWNDLLNISANLKSAVQCYCIATCGDDWAGKLVSEQLIANGIDISNITFIPQPTKRFHIIIDAEKTKSQSECPICKKNVWYSNDMLPRKMPEYFKAMSNKGVIIIDSLKKALLGLAKSFRSEGWFLAADIGHINHLRYLSTENLLTLLSDSFDLLQTNKHVYKFLINKFGCKGDEELFAYLDCKYLNITDGSNGSRFIYRTTSGKIEIIESVAISTAVVDPTGAGDAFFSQLICSLDESGNFSSDIYSIVKKASVYAAERVATYGATGHYQKYSPPEGVCKACGIAEHIQTSSKIRQQKITINTNRLLDRALSALDLKVADKLNQVLRTIHQQVIMVGTGGSFTAAEFAAKVVTQYHHDVYAIACKPRDIIINGVSKTTAVFLFSYSGKTNDIRRIYNLCKKNNVPVYVITQLSYDEAEAIYDRQSIISYGTSKANTREHGFISMAGVFIPMCLFGEVYFRGEKRDFRIFLNECFERRRFEFSSEKYFSKLPKRKLTVDIFSGVDTQCTAIALESMFIESGLGRAIVHEKKDFSHGRFNIVEKYIPDLVIYLDNINGAYSEKLFQYLTKRNCLNICHLKSDFGIIWGDFDLFVAAQYFAKYLSKATGYDMADPTYPDDAMTLYRYLRKDLY